MVLGVEGGGRIGLRGRPSGPGSRLPSSVSFPSRIVERARACWQGASLTQRFATTAAMVIVLGMGLLGWWVNQRIQDAVVQNSAAHAALYLVGFVEPHVQSLRDGNLPKQAMDDIDDVFTKLSQQRSFVGLKVWGPGGRLLYASDKVRTGQVFPESEELRGAWRGTIMPEYNGTTDDESEVERKLNKPLLEVYAPMRNWQSKEVVAVAEVYEVATKLHDELSETFFKTMLALGSISLLMLGSLANIVAQGSRTIERQQRALSDRVGELSTLLSENRELQRRVADANARSVQSNEQLLRRIGADLHDGPAQLIAFALLRLDAVRAGVSATNSASTDVSAVKDALSGGLREIRAICAGVALPELRGKTLSEVILMAVGNHESRTGTSVTVDLGSDLPRMVEFCLATSVYRLVQEGLNNATRHAGASGQRVDACIEGQTLALTVSDTGRGMMRAADECLSSKSGLGLRGLADRIQALGGTFEVTSPPGGGTRLHARFDLNALIKDAGGEHA